MKKFIVLIISILMVIPLVNTSIVLANEDCKHSFNGVEIDLDKIYSEEEANNLGFTNIAGTTSYVFICDNCNANLMVNIPIEEPKEDVTETPSEDEPTTDNEIPSEEPIILDKAEDITKKISEYVISAVLGILGTVSVSLVFKNILAKLIESIVVALKDLKAKKKEVDEELVNNKNEVERVLASLEKSHSEMMKGFEEMKAQLEEENRKNNEQMQKANAQVKADIDLIKTAIPYMAGGMNELVRNGIAESVYDLLKKGEVNEESEEI